MFHPNQNLNVYDLQKSFYDYFHADITFQLMRSEIGIVRPIQEFFKQESTSGIILIFSTVLAMIAANSPLSDLYFDFLHYKVDITIEDQFFSMEKPVEVWINDFLMAIFFFVIGLEIKREIIGGELSNIKAASLPIAAAIGGMAIPALFYIIINFKHNSDPSIPHSHVV